MNKLINKRALHLISILLVFALVVIPTLTAFAETTIFSANGYEWDVEDKTEGPTDGDGGIDDGSHDAFDDFGGISVAVTDKDGTFLKKEQDLSDFGLTLVPGEREFVTTTPMTLANVMITRHLYSPADSDYMRYIDTFTNTTGTPLVLLVDWGGDLGSDSNTTVSLTDSGDLNLTIEDTWGVTIQNSSHDANGEASDPVVGYALGSVGNSTIKRVISYYSSPRFVWGGNGDDEIGFEYGFDLKPGETVKLSYFLYRGLDEQQESLPAGSQAPIAAKILKAIVANPDDYFGDLTPTERSQIINWKLKTNSKGSGSGNNSSNGSGNNNSNVSANASVPDTGFAHGRVTTLPAQPVEKKYTASDMTLKIPAINVDTTIVGVPASDNGWDVTWLGSNAGYLAGSAFPTWEGNSVITGHVWGADNKPGVFVDIRNLKYGDQIQIFAWGQVYTYEVRESRLVSPTRADLIFQHEDEAWVTLLSCETYNPFSENYLFRRMVRAVLVSVVEVK